MLAAAAGTAATASWDANVCGADFFVKPLVHTRTPHEGEEGKRQKGGRRERWRTRAFYALYVVNGRYGSTANCRPINKRGEYITQLTFNKFIITLYLSSPP